MSLPPISKVGRKHRAYVVAELDVSKMSDQLTGIDGDDATGVWAKAFAYTPALHLELVVSVVSYGCKLTVDIHRADLRAATGGRLADFDHRIAKQKLRQRNPGRLILLPRRPRRLIFPKPQVIPLIPVSRMRKREINVRFLSDDFGCLELAPKQLSRIVIDEKRFAENKSESGRPTSGST